MTTNVHQSSASCTCFILFPYFKLFLINLPRRVCVCVCVHPGNKAPMFPCKCSHSPVTFVDSETLAYSGSVQDCTAKKPSWSSNGNAQPTIEWLSISRASSRKLPAFASEKPGLPDSAGIFAKSLNPQGTKQCWQWNLATFLGVQNYKNVSDPNSKPKKQNVKPKTQNKDTLFAPTFNWMDFQEVTSATDGSRIERSSCRVEHCELLGFHHLGGYMFISYISYNCVFSLCLYGRYQCINIDIHYIALYCIITYIVYNVPPRRYMLRSLPVRGAIYIQNYISLRLKIQRTRILWDFVSDNMTLHLRTLAMMDQGLVITHHTRYTLVSSRTLHFDSGPSLKSVSRWLRKVCTIEVHPPKITPTPLVWNPSRWGILDSFDPLLWGDGKHQPRSNRRASSLDETCDCRKKQRRRALEMFWYFCKWLSCANCMLIISNPHRWQSGERKGNWEKPLIMSFLGEKGVII